MNIYYVYIYYSRGGIPYYVGNGKNNRITEHISSARNGKRYPLANKIRSLLKNNETPLFQKVACDLSEDGVYELEKYLIDCYRRRLDGGTLLNLSVGGEKSSLGIVAHNKGVACTEEAKTNISKKLKLYYSTRDSPRKGAEGLSFWLNPKSEKATWTNLDLFYKYYLMGLSNKLMAKVFIDISAGSFQSVIRYFKIRGNPLEDSEWLEYKANNGEHAIKESPYNLRANFQYPQGLENAENIQELVKFGKGVKYIADYLCIPYGAVCTVVRDIKRGWKPEEDVLYLFARDRSKELKGLNNNG